MELKYFSTLYGANIVPEFGNMSFLYIFSPISFFSFITWNGLISNYKVIVNAIKLVSIPPSISRICINLV